MDQLTAHLDRGWDHIQRGDAQGAEASARRALELDAQSPEAFNLLGYASAMRGDYDTAIESYRQAIALDDTYLEAMLNAAEVFLHPLREYDDALEMCAQALDLAETKDELVDTLLLEFDALTGKHEHDRAAALAGRFPPGPYENPVHGFLVGRAHYEVGSYEKALPLIEEAVRQMPDHPEAWYYLGLLREEHGDRVAATDALLRSRELELGLAPPPWSLSTETFRATIRRVVESLEPRLQAFLRRDEIYVAELPGVELVVDGVDPHALLLLDAVSGEPPTARLIVYQRNVERLVASVDEIEDETRTALEQEITAYFLGGEAPPDGRVLN
ncbi:MAG: tetratricopeptide repeat protein [Polyangiaceae bacterium]|nr:tetratricopeptide repeat protein [Polyangiaceae bacterium]